MNTKTSYAWVTCAQGDARATFAAHQTTVCRDLSKEPPSPYGMMFRMKTYAPALAVFKEAK